MVSAVFPIDIMVYEHDAEYSWDTHWVSILVVSTTTTRIVDCIRRIGAFGHRCEAAAASTLL